MLVLGLKENLLSVGQMMEHGYHLVFGNQKAEIYDDGSYSNLVVKVPMRGNRSFPLKLQAEMHIAYKANNGVVERKNRTIVEMAKCMMFEKSMPLEFWVEAVNTAVYILNSIAIPLTDMIS
ncbi:unnamed protein product [Prunus brigantina]